MQTLNEFARTKGAKDKQKRKDKTLGSTMYDATGKGMVAAGLSGGLLMPEKVSKIMQEGKFIPKSLGRANWQKVVKDNSIGKRAMTMSTPSQLVVGSLAGLGAGGYYLGKKLYNKYNNKRKYE